MTAQVSIRVWGEFACWTRPEMKVERVSYPVPTPSGVRGVLEAILWKPQLRYVIDSIVIVRRGRWFSFRRNEVSKVVSIQTAQKWMTGTQPVGSIAAGGGAPDAAQRNMLALAGVEYVVNAEIHLTDLARPPADSLPKYVEQFRNRVIRGKCGHRPALGCREFPADFEWVDDASSIVPAEPYSEDLGLVLYDVFDPVQRAVGRANHPDPVFFHARVEDGHLECHPDRVRLVRRPPSGVEPCS